MLSPAEVAQLANVSLKTVYREIDRGALPAVQVGRTPNANDGPAA
jgi:excisionase family DNA binding protein